MSSTGKKKAKPKVKRAAQTKAKPRVAKTKKPARAVAPKEEVKPKKAAKPRKVAEKKEVPREKVAEPRPVVLGPPPAAAVAARHLDSLHERAARGFSFGELTSAGVSLETAKREGLSVDIRRRSVREENVDSLKVWLRGEGSGLVKVAVPAVPKK